MQNDSEVSENPAKGASSLVALLGASNLSRGYGCLTHCLSRSVHPAGIEFLNARGPGRGYCVEGGLFSVVYPPIGTCGIRSAIRERAIGKAHVAALITDIGNDIMYGVSPGTLIHCLEQIIDELHELGAGILVTAIHVNLEHDVGEGYFNILRRIFYPRSKVSFAGAAAAVQEVNAFLEEAARDKIVLLREMEPFCGIDKIHYSLMRSHQGWSLVAEALLRMLNGARTRKITPLHMTGSLATYLSDLYFRDMIPLMEKREGTF